MRVPDWWAFLLLTLGTFRIVRIIGWDDISTGLRSRLLMPDREYWMWAKMTDDLESRGIDPWAHKPDPDLPSRRRFYVAKLIHCPWCAGFWWSIVAYSAWLVSGRVTLYIATPLALSSVIGLIAKNGDP